MHLRSQKDHTGVQATLRDEIATLRGLSAARAVEGRLA